ncbi:MAG: archaeosortase/exosortase family protein [Candidatus Aenigmatarchaeota archaeon]
MIAMKRNIDNAKLKRILGFLLKFNIFAIPLYLIILSGFQSPFLINLTTDFSFSLIHFSGIDATRNGLISVPTQDGEFAASIDWDCTGWKSMLALFALIFATDFGLRKKLYGLALIPVVYAVNIARIWFMFFYVSSFGTAHYQFVHATVWSWGLILTILVLWVVWMRRFPDKKHKKLKKKQTTPSSKRAGKT